MLHLPTLLTWALSIHPLHGAAYFLGLRVCFYLWCVSINRHPIKHPIKPPGHYKCCCHYVKVFGVDGDYSLCIYVHPPHCCRAKQTSFLVHFLIQNNQCQYVRWHNDVRTLSCASIPFTLASLVPTNLPKMKEERRLHLRNWECCHPQHCATKLGKRLVTLSLNIYVHLFSNFIL